MAQDLNRRASSFIGDFQLLITRIDSQQTKPTFRFAKSLLMNSLCNDDDDDDDDAASNYDDNNEDDKNDDNGNVNNSNRQLRRQ